MAAPDNSALEDAKKRARRRLVGAVVLALAAAVVLPMFLESDPRPLGPDVQIQIPAIDDAKFQNRLTPPGAPKSAPTDKIAQPAASETVKAPGEAADAGPTAVPAAAGTESTGSKAEPPAAAPAAAAAATPGEAKTPAPLTSAVIAAPTATPARKAVTPANPPAARAPATPPPSASAPGGKSAPPIPAPAPAASLPAFSLTATVPPPGAAPAPDSQAVQPVAAPPVAQGEFVVQLGAFIDSAVARDLAVKASEQGFSVFLEPVTTKSGRVQRVRAGPFATRGEANAAAAKFKGAGFTADVRPR